MTTRSIRCRNCGHVFASNRMLVDVGDRLVPCCPECRTVADLRAPPDAHAALERNVRRTVALAALRRIRGLVDEYHRDDGVAKKANRIIAGAAAAVIVAIAALALTGHLTWAFRSISGALGS